MVLQDVALYCTVLHCIILNITILHGIALLASARGLYLARHLFTLLLLFNKASCFSGVGGPGQTVQSPMTASHSPMGLAPSIWNPGSGNQRSPSSSSDDLFFDEGESDGCRWEVNTW